MRTENTEMNGDILFEGLPALKRDGENYLIYSPYKKVFVNITRDALNTPDIIKGLKEDGIFDFPQPQYTNSKRVVLTVTKRCNLFCKYCFANSGPHIKEEMLSMNFLFQPKKIMNIIDEVQEHFSANLKIWEIIKLFDMFHYHKDMNKTQ